MKERNEINTSGHNDLTTVADPGDRVSLRPYQPPRVISAENLEAAAATCSPPTGPYGKTKPTPCGILGS